MQTKFLRTPLICAGLVLFALNNVSEAVLTAAEDLQVQAICTRVQGLQHPVGSQHNGPFNSIRHFSLFKSYVSDNLAAGYVNNNPNGLGSLPAGRNMMRCPGCKSEWQELYHIGQAAGMTNADRNTKFKDVMTKAASLLGVE